MPMMSISMKRRLKQVGIGLLLLVLTLSLPSTILATSYGQCGYGESVYNDGCSPTTPPTTGSPSYPPSSPPQCTDPAPGPKAPQIYAATSQSTSSILLHFTEGDGPFDSYALQFGTKSGEYTYGASNIGGGGTKKYLVQLLSSNTVYYFRIRASNGCAIGPWSNEISAKTKPLVSFRQVVVTDSSLEEVPTNGSQEQSGTKKEEGYHLNVKVIDEKNDPIKGAKITIHSKVQESITDDNGLVRFEDVEQGQHQVLIAYNGYQGEQTVNLTGDIKEFNLNFTIQMKPVLFAPQVLIIIGVMGSVIVVLTFLLWRSKSRLTQHA